ncbi:hypothetical protein [Tuberibacillus sp. Marseille-P3662]|uniref:hypothetical protein n=1 Tax=Tuberibacillus sp. Marseille-P3662 TaxID=1965358 RepID=UPI001592B25A|nr:hypothetical protein [Tuberibacillus sp. Marseille-P3662]
MVVQMSIVMLFLALLSAWDMARSIKGEKKKEWVVYSAVMLIGWTLSILVILHISI